MHTEILRSLRIRHAPHLDQPHSLKLELPRKFPPLHDPPPVPLKHLTRCLRNRMQARLLLPERRIFRDHANGGAGKEGAPFPIVGGLIAPTGSDDSLGRRLRGLMEAFDSDWRI